jgi:hypothetical protein
MEKLFGFPLRTITWYLSKIVMREFYSKKRSKATKIDGFVKLGSWEDAKLRKCELPNLIIS